MRLRPFSLCRPPDARAGGGHHRLNLLALAVRFPFYAAVPLGVVAWKNLGRWRLSTAHGSARAVRHRRPAARGMIGGAAG